MTEERNPIQPKTLRKGPIDQSEKKLRNFWEEVVGERPEDVDVALQEVILKLLGKAKETIFLSSPKITLPEVRVALDKAHGKGTRVYALTSNIGHHQKLFECGIMRENQALASTCVLVDPKGNAEGVWFPGELTSESNPRILVKLNKKQAREAWAHFSQHFWQADGQELFFGKIRGIAELDGQKPEFAPCLESVARDGDFKMLDGSEINQMILPNGRPAGFEYYLTSRELGVPLGKDAREVIDALDLGCTRLRATEDHVFGYTELDTTRGKHVVFDWDTAITLSDGQFRELRKSLPRLEWEFNKEKTMGDVKGQVILEAEDWNKPSPQPIQESGTIALDDVESETMKDWLEEKPEPEIPDTTHLYRSVEYTWILKPPRLPSKSKKHRLYGLWDKFDAELGKEVDKTIREFDDAVSMEKSLDLKKRQKILKISQWKQWIQELETIRGETWRHKKDIDEVKVGLTQLKDIQRGFARDVRGIEVVGKKGVGKTRKETNELQEFLGLSYEEKEIKTPPDIMPTVGTLHESGNQSYIVVEYEEDIPKAQKISKRYRARIVAKRSD